MGATFIEYPEPQQNNPQKDFNAALPTNLQQADLVRMGMSQTQADKVIADVGYGGTGGTQPPGGNTGGTGGGGESWRNNPFEPKTHQVFRILAHDHRTGTETDIDYAQKGVQLPLDQEIIRRAPPPEVAYKIQRGIVKAIGLKNEADLLYEEGDKKLGKRKRKAAKSKTMEIKVALYFGPAVTNFNQHYNEAGHPIPREMKPYTEVDVETDTYMIEVTIGKSSKLEQIEKYCTIDTQERHVIVFAPNIKNKAKINSITNTGAHFVKDFRSMTKLVRKLGMG